MTEPKTIDNAEIEAILRMNARGQQCLALALGVASGTLQKEFLEKVTASDLQRARRIVADAHGANIRSNPEQIEWEIYRRFLERDTLYPTPLTIDELVAIARQYAARPLLAYQRGQAFMADHGAKITAHCTTPRISEWLNSGLRQIACGSITSLPPEPVEQPAPTLEEMQAKTADNMAKHRRNQLEANRPRLIGGGMSEAAFNAWVDREMGPAVSAVTGGK